MQREYPSVRNYVVGGLVVGLGLVGIARLGRRRFETTVSTHVDDLLAAVDSEEVTARKAGTDLPAPVERYLDRVLPDGQPAIRTVRLRQRGEFRLGGTDAPWKPLTATQYATTQPPGFVWNATIDVRPFLPVRVLDLYERGRGILRAHLLGFVPVASAGPNREMNEGELVRYLAEAVWFPTALRPSQGIEWEPIDDRSARATLEHAGVTASVVFHFDDRNFVSRVTADRYRQEDDSYAPWTGYFREYETHHGFRIPTEAQVEWTLPEGALPYWRATITDVTYRTAPARGGSD